MPMRRAATLAGLALLAAVPSVTTPIPLPNHSLTPGHAFPGVTAATVCRASYASSVRAVPSREKRAVYRRYGLLHHARGRYVIDHLIPLELGGDNTALNLWPEPATGPANSHDKDGLEDYLHRAVCAGREPLAQAQRAIATNWYAAWVAAGRPAPPRYAGDGA